MCDGDRIAFASALPLHMRGEVETLFFFNPRQSLSSDGIHAAVAAAGLPAIATNHDAVWIEVPPGTTQCLFARDQVIAPSPVVGVALYSRPALDTIWISHIAVAPGYAHAGEHAAMGVAARLVDRVVTIAGRITGITRVQLPYRAASYIRIKRARTDTDDRIHA